VGESKRPEASVNARVGESGIVFGPSGTRLAWRTRSAAAIFALAFATLFLLAHPYVGIWQDAILYTVQAVRDAHPEHFTHDLFFQFGSQDDWTLYGKLYERLINLVGIRAGNRFGLAAAQVLWWTGMWRLSKRLLPAPWYWVSLLLAAGMPANYGGGFALSYDEFFLTARLPAEALSLWAIAFVLERRSIAALLTALTAMAIHPLIGAVGFATVLIVATPRFPWWRLFAAALAVFAIAQFLAPSPWAIHPFDSEWRSVIRSTVPYLFPSEWPVLPWSRAGWVIALPLMLAAIDTTERHRIWASLALVGIAGVGFATLAALAGHDAFWIQVQLWRALWLLSAVQWVAVLSVVRREWGNRPAMLWLLAVCWLGLELAGGGIAALLLAALMHFERFARARGKPVRFFRELTLPHKACLSAGTLAAASLGVAYQLIFAHAHALVSPATLNFDLPWLEAVIHTRLMVVLVVVLSIAALLRERFPPAAVGVLLILLLAYAIVNFDQRSPTAKIMEARLDAPARAPFAGRVAAGQMVYWDGPVQEIVYPWLLMRTSSYFSVAQTAGIVFHRETTFEAVRRQAIVHGPRTSADAYSGFRYIGSFKPLKPDGILRVCREPGLDFVVSPMHYAGLSTNDEWAPTGQSTYWLYDCRQLNAKAALSVPKNG